MILTGAGISAESGVPTFRGAGGLWKKFSAGDLATPEAFQRDPRLCWEWYGWRREILADRRPNRAHLAIARFLAGSPDSALITQNVDGLHQAAAQEIAPTSGAPLSIINLHGSIFRVRCTSCDFTADHRGPIDTTSVDALPHCKGCMALLRPDVVWFGEALPADQWRRATAAASVAQACLVVGTQGAVYPAAGLVAQARKAGARVIVVDPGETAFDSIADVRLVGKAGEIVPMILPDVSAP